MASRVGNQMFWDRHTTGNERRRILRAAILLMNFANFLEKNKSSSKILLYTVQSNLEMIEIELDGKRSTTAVVGERKER